ncbi:MAG: hypothetical protein HOW73_47910 [Polyangiaceae bacterium]|nr:hypothetical protein [Polyangiaceae bacterium]
MNAPPVAELRAIHDRGRQEAYARFVPKDELDGEGLKAVWEAGRQSVLAQPSGFSDRDVFCERCNKHGRRPFMHPAPRGWLFLETVLPAAGPLPNESVIVLACSTECAHALWTPGPGNRWSSAEVEAAAEPDNAVRVEEPTR